MKHFTNKKTRQRLAELTEDGSLDRIKEKCEAKRLKNKEKLRFYRDHPNEPRRPYTFGTIQDFKT